MPRGFVAAAAAPLEVPGLQGTPLLPMLSLAVSLLCLGASVLLVRRGAGGGGGGQGVVRARYIVNAAGEGSGHIARMLGDDSFYIKPRIGEYLLLNKDQGHKVRFYALLCACRGPFLHPPRHFFTPIPPPLPPQANHILFPTPSKMGKGVLVQTTLWGNLILGPTAADVSDPATPRRTATDIMAAILARCRDLVPSFDASHVIHSFSGRRSKSSTGDWIIKPCFSAPDCIHAAGIDSPGLAGSPAIALRVSELLRAAGLKAPANATFNPNRRAIIVPKYHASNEVPLMDDRVGGGGRAVRRAAGRRAALKTPTVSEFKSPALWPPPEQHVVCRCEKVTEAEVVDAARRSLPCDSTQAVRKRTRAGMGHCQGEFCEDRVKCLLARERGVGIGEVAGRPWPGSSILPSRWLSEEEKLTLAGLGAGQ